MDNRYRKTIIAGNWKMNKLPSEVKPYADELKALLPVKRCCECVLCVPSVLIHGALSSFKDLNVAVGAQNVNENVSGAFTGEVSAAQLSELGVEYVIVGHSERREFYGETNPAVNKKLVAALNAGLRPILCVGETLTQREHDVALEFIALEVKTALFGFTSRMLRRVVIAYEPIWAIGNGKAATAKDAEDACREIRAVLRKHYGASVARSVPILYGGSMNENNASELLAQPDIDGGLIGGASLVPKKYAAIVAAANELCGVLE